MTQLTVPEHPQDVTAYQVMIFAWMRAKKTLVQQVENNTVSSEEAKEALTSFRDTLLHEFPDHSASIMSLDPDARNKNI